MKKTKIFGLVLLLSALVILSGCTAPQKTQDTQYNENADGLAAQTIQVKKGAGGAEAPD